MSFHTVLKYIEELEKDNMTSNIIINYLANFLLIYNGKLFSLALFIALLYSFWFQGLIAYNLYLLEIEPEYLWWYKGSQEAVPWKTIDLERAERWIYDSTGNNLNLDNWFTRLHFENIEKWKIGMIGSVYFFGFIGGSFLTRFADIQLNKNKKIS